MSIKNVALMGATGSLGAPILSALLASNNFNVTVLTRSSSSSTFPAGVSVKEVDYSSLPSLTAALEGIDALVNANNQTNPSDALRVVDAVVAAGVRRYIPPDFGIDPASPLVHSLPVFGTKVVVHDRILAEAKANPAFTWTIVSNGPFLDWGLYTTFMGIDLKGRKIGLFESGENVHPWTLLSDVAKAVAGVLAHPDETINRAVYVHSMYKSQKEVAALAKEVLGGTWEETSVPVTQRYEESMESIKAGIINWGTLAPLIQYAISRPEGSTVLESDDNDLVGVTELSDEELKAVIQKWA